MYFTREVFIGDVEVLEIREVQTGNKMGKIIVRKIETISRKRVGIDGGNSPEKSLWERKRSLRALRLERLGMGPERWFCLRLITRSWVRAVSDSNEPWRSGSLRTSRETRSWRHETPVQAHGLVVEFQVVSLFVLSVLALSAKRGSKSGFFEAWEKRKWRMRRKKWKVEEHTDLGSPLLFVFLLMIGFVFVVLVFGWQEKLVAGFVFGWQERSVAGFVFVFLDWWFLDFNFVFLNLDLWFCYLFRDTLNLYLN